MPHLVPPEIVAVIGPLLQKLAALDIYPTDSRYLQSFGDFYIDFSSSRGWFRVVRDRTQYYANGGSQETLERADLWRAHDNQQEFEIKLLKWLEGRAA
jgi:hypothetical protein